MGRAGRACIRRKGHAARRVPHPGAQPQCGFAQSQGRKLLFVGDTVWLKRAVTEHLAKPLVSRSADAQPAQVRDQIERLADCVRLDPAVEIIPAHDAATQDTLGYFPIWVH